MAEVIISSGWGIASGDILALNFSRNRDMLSWRKTKGILGVREAEAIERRVVRDGNLFGEREFTPFLGTKNWLATCKENRMSWHAQ